MECARCSMVGLEERESGLCVGCETIEALESEIERKDRTLAEEVSAKLAALEELDRLRVDLEDAEAELSERRRDAEAAAGELLVSLDDVPPGSVAGKLLAANAVLRSERTGARQNASRYAQGWAHDAERRDEEIARALRLLDALAADGMSWGPKLEEIKAVLEGAKSPEAQAGPSRSDVDRVIEHMKGEAERISAVLATGLEAVERLIDDSEGVAGLHQNGDVAPWDSLRSDGLFGAWLADFDRALEVLRAPADEGRGCFYPNGAIAVEEVAAEAPDDGTETTIGRMVRTSKFLEGVAVGTGAPDWKGAAGAMLRVKARRVVLEEMAGAIADALAERDRK